MGPLLPPFVSFAAGIALGDRLGALYFVVVPALACSAALVAAAYAMRLRFTPLILAPLFLFLGALFIIPHSQPDIPADHIVNRAGKDGMSDRAGVIVEGEVASVESTGRRTRVWLDAEGVVSNGVMESASGRVLLTVNGRAELLPGDRIRALATLNEPYAFGNPGEFDYKRWLKRRGVLVTGFVKSERLIERVEAGSGPAAAVQRARAAIARFIDSSGAGFPGPLKALVVSGQGSVDKGLREAFASTGTAHILSISGLHVGMVAAFSYWAAMFLLRRSERALLYLDAKRTALVISTAPVVVYAVLAGLPVPTQRALVMVLAFTASFALGRGKDHLNTLSLAGLVILAIHPGSLWDASFQLSFGAMASIILVAPRLNALVGKGAEEGREGWKGALASFARRRALPLVFVTVAAGLGTSPILAWHFHRVSLAGLAANLVVVPLAGVVVPVLLMASALLPFSEPLARLVLFPADLVFGAMAWVVELFAALPWASMWVSPPSFHQVLLYYALLFSVACLGRARLFKYSAAAAAALLILPAAVPPEKEGAALLRATFLSVGQGDSALVELPGGKTMLVDGGGTNSPDFDVGERVVAPFLRTRGISRIDYMVLSHAQHDHMGGLPFIAKNFEVGEFWWNGDGGLGALGDALVEKGVPIRTIKASTPPVKAGGAAIEFFSPREGSPLDRNDNSLVFRISHGRRSILFTGDIGEKAERLITGQDISADVLKAPHHGSRYSSSGAFLSAVGPSAVVVSAGRKNRFGFPHGEALSRYEEAGAEVLRTDAHGAVIVETDGEYLRKTGHLTRRAP